MQPNWVSLLVLFFLACVSCDGYKGFVVCFTLTVHQYTPVLLICISLHRATTLGVKQNHVYTFFPFISLTHAHAHRVEHTFKQKGKYTTIAPVQFKRKGEWRNLRYVYTRSYGKQVATEVIGLRRIKKSFYFVLKQF